MLICNKLSEAKQLLGDKGTAVALGTFDGVHIGHQSIIQRAMNLAKAHKLVSVVYTFSNHPLEQIAPDKVPMQIGDNISKADILKAMGVQMLVNVAFNEKLCRQSPEAFIDELCHSLNPHYLVTGPNFSFGAKAKGNPRMLLRMGEEYGFQAEVGQAVQLDGRMVSSTRIRSLIEAGDLEKTNEYLGRYFSFGGRVIHGDHRGRTLGFPTANVAWPELEWLPAIGVYVVQLKIGERWYDGMASVGRNVTFGDHNEKTLEINLFDFNQLIYGENVQVRWIKRLRGEVKFNSADDLIAQMRLDQHHSELTLQNLKALPGQILQ